MAKRYSLRRDGLYEVTCRVNGKKKHFYGRTQTEAAAKRDKYLDSLEDYPYIDEKIPLGEWLDAWVESCKNEFSPITYKDYRAVIHFYLSDSPIAKARLENLKPVTFRLFLNNILASGRAPRTVAMVHQVLSGAMKRAVADGVIRVNPMDGVKRPRSPARHAVTVLSPAQLQVLLPACSPDWFSRLVRLDLYTGLRRGEILALSFNDVNFDKMTLSVTHTVISNGGAVISESAKTDKSIRTISICPAAADILHAQKAYVLRLRMARAGKPGADSCELFFPNAWLRPYDPNTITKFFHQAIVRAGLDGSGISFHTLRHTHATYLLEQGVNIKVIQDRLGHASSITTLDYYSGVTPKMDRAAADISSGIIPAAADSKEA